MTNPDGTRCGAGPLCVTANLELKGQDTCRNGACVSPAPITCQFGCANNMCNAAPVCGSPGQACCQPGDICTDGKSFCANNICTPCGANQQPCCEPDLTCNADLICIADLPNATSVFTCSP
jgi:hypothetical protein